MKRQHSFLVCATLVAALLSCTENKQSARANRFVRAEGKGLVTPEGNPLKLRGINLGNWLLPEGYMFKLEVTTAHWQIQQVIKELVGPADARAFWKQYYQTYITREDIRFIKQTGCNSLRVPFNYKLLTPEDYPEIWLEHGFALLDSVIAWSKQEGLYVILDMHAAPGGQTGTNIDDSAGHPWLFESAESQERTIAIWRKLAERYRDEPTVIAYELLNEPIPHFEGYEKFNPLLEPLYQRMVAAIREVDAHHVIILGGAQWNTNFRVFGPPFAENLVYAFHKYWMEPVQEQIQEYVDFRERHQVPIYMSESGENTDAWIAAYRTLLEQNDIGWCFWPYKKMAATSCMRTFAPPPYWDEIIAFAKIHHVDPADIKKYRPPLEHSRAALAGFLENIRFHNTSVNDGYIAALDLQTSSAAP